MNLEIIIFWLYCTAAAAFILEALILLILYVGLIDLSPAARSLHQGCSVLLMSLALISMAAMILCSTTVPRAEFGIIGLVSFRIGLWHRHLSNQPPSH